MNDGSGMTSPGFSELPLWQRVLISFAFIVGTVGGGSGIAAVVQVFDQPDPPAITCVSYWNEIGEQKQEGFTRFELQSDDALEERCGKAEDVADGWSDGGR